MLLIATDEAGYGPKLGPLVIAATAWKCPEKSLNTAQIDQKFSPMRESTRIGSLRIKIDDSKAVYKSGHGLDVLHAIASACLCWCGNDAELLADLLPRIASQDRASIFSTPWLTRFSTTPFLNSDQTRQSLFDWRSTSIELLDIQTRIVTAAKFNQACDHGRNKADLLSESTLGLVKTLIETHAVNESEIRVYCDRHGGRRYYGGVLQHVFDDAVVQVVGESNLQSEYRLTIANKKIHVAFTVKGDSFTPVAMSSLLAKYLRERMMESFNTFFASLHSGKVALRPTAGYPTDAARFLKDIELIIREQRIPHRELIRSR